MRRAWKGNGGGLSLAGDFALPGESLFFASPKKSNPKKGEPTAGPLRGALRCSRPGGSSQTCPLRGLRTCELLIPVSLRCSARPTAATAFHANATGTDEPSSANEGELGLCAVGRAEQRRGLGDKRRSCPRAEGPSSAPPPRRRAAQGTPQGPGRRLAFSLPSFFWRSKRKKVAREGETPLKPKKKKTPLPPPAARPTSPRTPHPAPPTARGCRARQCGRAPAPGSRGRPPRWTGGGR